MRISRRNLLASAAAAPKLSAAGGRVFDIAAIRADFPRTRTAAYFDNASCHPLSVQSAAALHRFIEWNTHDMGEPWWPQWSQPREQAKGLFASLIGAKPNEVAFIRSTVEAESNLLNGMDIQAAGGNVVTNDLHFSAALYNYKMRRKAGLDVRIVKHRGWTIDMRDMERAVDAKTKLVAIALVSNVNGYLHDVKAISELAHARGALVYADIIQCAGAIPIDVRAMGIDLAACSTYKWLMGLKGFGFAYIREDLQGAVVKPTQHSGGVRFNYAPWTAKPDAAEDVAFEPVTGPSRYEVSYPSCAGVVCALESLEYIRQLGVANIRTHVRSLTDRLQKELPALGYPSITPIGNESPILAFECKDPDGTLAKLRRADVRVAMRFGNKMRIASSVYNNREDVDRLLNTLS